MGPTTADLETNVQALVDELNGTCNTMPDWVEDHAQEQEIREGLDQELFLCAACSWWCEQSEANEGPEGEDVCGDCSDDVTD